MAQRTIHVDCDDETIIESPPDLTRRSGGDEMQADDVDSNLRWKNRVCSVLSINVDYSMEPATTIYEPLDVGSRESPQLVPVLRFYGPIARYGYADPFQSACLYIHNAFPYIIARPRKAGFDGRPEISCPWNSFTTVQSMVEGISEALESALVSSIPTTTNDRKQKTSPAMVRSIRQITVVQGRGFYTYCDGPAAPFLRVEYYNPSDRWKVKRCLEQGLKDLLVGRYHPSTHDEEQDENPVLAFHCFEAHIPYTMQFFKDWNLSGMSYIHLDSCQFREPLPNKGEADDVDAMFLSSNTPDVLRRNRWRKEMSTHVELDADVSAILNVLDVMTEAPDDPQIQWRAVPSLREIWMQERRRMSKLLDPKDDFLNYPPPFEKRSASGAQLAVEGMRSLVQQTPGLEDDYRRAMRDILERNAWQVKQREVALASDSVRADDNDDANDNTTPTHSQTLKALFSMNTENGPDETEMEGIEETTPTSLGEKKAHLEPDRKYASMSQIFHAQGHRKAVLDLDHDTLTQKIDRGDGVVELGASFDAIEDVIDPQTLLPYEDIGDENSQDVEDENISEGEFEQQLATMATQTLPTAIRADQGVGSACSDASSVDSLELLQGETAAARDAVTAASLKLLISGDKSESLPLDPSPTETYSWQHKADVWVCPQKDPPSRKDLVDSCSRQTRLYPMPFDGDIPAWISFVGAKKCTTKKNPWFPPIGPHGLTVKPLKPPPSYSTVRSWSKKKKNASHTTTPKKNPSTRTMSKDAVSRLRIDENSHKIVADNVDMDGSTAYGIEEVGIISRTGERDALSEDDEAYYSEAHERNVERTDDNKGSVESSTPTRSSSEVGIASTHSAPSQSETPSHERALKGVANQGGRLLLEEGGELKAKTKISQLTQKRSKLCSGQGLSDSLSSPVTLLSVEIFVQCRTGKAGLNDPTTISLTPDPSRDKILSICFYYAR